jgi:hypothetical protein
VKGLGTSVLNFLANVRLFFGYQDSDATAKVLVGDADITAFNGSVVLTADAKSEAKSFTVGPWVAATYLDSFAWSEVKVGSGAAITASRDVLINARNTNTLDATSLLFRGGRELPGASELSESFNKGQSKNPFSFTVTITTGEQHAYATVEQGAEIIAGHHVDVIARSERTLSSSATGSSRNQLLGIGFTLNVSTSTADAVVHGKVTASAGDVTVLAQTVSAKNKTVALFDAGQSDFASEKTKKAAQYLQLARVGTNALTGSAGLTAAIGALIATGLRNPAGAKPPTSGAGGSMGVIVVGIASTEATANAWIGGTAVVSAGGNVTVRADALDRPDISSQGTAAVFIEPTKEDSSHSESASRTATTPTTPMHGSRGAPRLMRMARFVCHR